MVNGGDTKLSPNDSGMQYTDSKLNVSTKLMILKRGFGLNTVINGFFKLKNDSLGKKMNFTAYLQEEARVIMSELAMFNSIKFNFIQTSDCQVSNSAITSYTI